MDAHQTLFNMTELERAAALVHGILPPTPQYAWPKLGARAGCTVWVKHENPATRGNHGQSLAFAWARTGVPATIYVPHNNSIDQNSSIAAFGARVVEFGKDFDEARHEAFRVAAAEGLHFVPSFSTTLTKSRKVPGRHPLLRYCRSVTKWQTRMSPWCLAAATSSMRGFFKFSAALRHRCRRRTAASHMTLR